MIVYAVIDDRSGDNEVYSLHFAKHVAQRIADELQKEMQEIMGDEPISEVFWVREMEVTN